MGSPRCWGATIPAGCLPDGRQVAQATFFFGNSCGVADSTTCEAFPPPDTCCLFCETIDPLALAGQPIQTVHDNLKLVMAYDGLRLQLNWTPLPNAAYYQILCSENVAGPFELLATALGGESEWRDQRVAGSLPARQFFVVQPMIMTQEVRARQADLAQWEMNEGTGDSTLDQSGHNRNAIRWAPCPPAWGEETVDSCDVGFLRFLAFEGHPACPEHLRVVNADDWYRDHLQVCMCIRIFDEPTVDTGPYYIISNNSFGTMHGGFALRIDPGWLMVNGVREYHNRLTALVWNRDIDNWMTIQTPPPQAFNPTQYSVPLNQWVEICWVLDGANSMLVINHIVVGMGDQEFHSDNNGAPLIIGAGYRHATYPIEYPFRGDIDCIRIIDRSAN
jgi:hypothetical protein